MSDTQAHMLATRPETSGRRGRAGAKARGLGIKQIITKKFYRARARGQSKPARARGQSKPARAQSPEPARTFPLTVIALPGFTLYSLLFDLFRLINQKE